MWAARLSPRCGKDMSRIGRLPIVIPEGVTVTVNSNRICVAGPKGQLEWMMPAGVEVKIADKQAAVTTSASNLHGLSRSLIANMVKGVSDGWSKTLELAGTGYRASTTGAELNLSLGFSHGVKIPAPEGIAFEVAENKITVRGADKVKVGEVAAKIRLLRPADPYKAKGLKYEGEVIRRKAGKAAKAGATGPAAAGGGK
ncbi:MAG: 50S ribosomal protein L6 [Candidatus Amesbacteria bacterium GW2011_GWA2_47_11b]|uniref:Large ribosomal subunit protein uL6 n=1 Tax=Candidatus Amesbacteria bacterium GW2011_GWA2_47_11b TaxID=1618358 RepID=A0A0G1UIY0_9BACT|nr:MAG: 50S ribosomal protein L6 [Candidatus Amesbacteria bacterium GW2011_GWA2_47_11b]